MFLEVITILFDPVELSRFFNTKLLILDVEKDQILRIALKHLENVINFIM